jgi:hypothetical protein
VSDHPAPPPASTASSSQAPRAKLKNYDAQLYGQIETFQGLDWRPPCFR